jgi:hypothetical protein
MEHKVVQVIVYRGVNRIVIGQAEITPNGDINGNFNPGMLEGDITDGIGVTVPDHNLVITELKPSVKGKVPPVQFSHLETAVAEAERLYREEFKPEAPSGPVFYVGNRLEELKDFAFTNDPGESLLPEGAESEPLPRRISKVKLDYVSADRDPPRPELTITSAVTAGEEPPAEVPDDEQY